MDFYLAGPHDPPRRPAGSILLSIDNWDDWFRFETLFRVFVAQESGPAQYIGTTKIELDDERTFACGGTFKHEDALSGTGTMARPDSAIGTARN